MTDAPKNHRLEDVLAYRQGFLEGEKLAEFEAHLHDCTACQASLERVSRLLPALQQALMPKERSTEELWASVQARYAAEQKQKQMKPRRSLLRPRVWLPAAAVSAAAAILLVSRLLFQVAGPELAVRPGPDAGTRAHTGMVAAPHRPGSESFDGGDEDGGAEDGGADEDEAATGGK